MYPRVRLSTDVLKLPHQRTYHPQAVFTQTNQRTPPTVLDTHLNAPIFLVLLGTQSGSLAPQLGDDDMRLAPPSEREQECCVTSPPQPHSSSGNAPGYEHWQSRSRRGRGVVEPFLARVCRKEESFVAFNYLMGSCLLLRHT